MQQTFPMVAKTFQGLEDVLRDELIDLGAQNVEIGKRMVSFEGDLRLLYKANLCCRTAIKILRPIEKFSASDPDELYDAVRDIDWSKYMGPDSTFAIESTVNSADFTHSRYVTYRVKDGIADHFFDRCGRRPSIRVAGADYIFDVHISDDRVTISLNSSGEPLNRRGYRVEQTAAPINEVLAAGIILKTGWRGDCDFLDPMCGSGTFLIEAAMIAARINPGIYRESFAFEKWPDFDAALFEEIYNDDSAERTPECRICGGDIDPEAVNISRKNIRQARLDEYIEVVCRPFDEWTAPAAQGIIVTNPPYGERLKPESLDTLFGDLGTTLKNNFRGWNAWIIGYRDEQFAAIGLKPSVKFPILNGPLECQLREYVLFAGKYNDFKSQGGTVRNEEFDRDAGRRIRHLSDAEWRRESRKVNRKEFRPHRDFDERDERPKGSYKAKGNFHRKGEYRTEGERGEFRPKRDFKPKRDRGEFRPKGEFRPRGEFKPKGEKGEFRPKGDFKPKRDFKSQGAIEVPGKKPQIPEDKATVFSPVPIRSRRRSKPASDAGDSAE